MGTLQNWEPAEAFTHLVLPVTIINTPWKSPLCCILKDYISKSLIYVFWVGGCFCTKLFPFLRMKGSVQRDEQMQMWVLPHSCSQHTPGGRLGSSRCHRNGVTCAAGVCAPSQHRAASPWNAAPIPHPIPAAKSVQPRERVRGCSCLSRNTACRKPKSLAILICTVKTKPLKNSKTKKSFTIMPWKRQDYFYIVYGLLK